MSMLELMSPAKQNCYGMPRCVAGPSLQPYKYLLRPSEKVTARLATFPGPPFSIVHEFSGTGASIQVDVYSREFRELCRSVGTSRRLRDIMKKRRDGFQSVGTAEELSQPSRFNVAPSKRWSPGTNLALRRASPPDASCLTEVINSVRRELPSECHYKANQ